MFHDFDELSKEILEDIEKHDVLDSVKKITCPTLFIHGTMDHTTGFESARELFNHAIEPKTLELIDEASHNFDEDTHREQLLETIITWFVKTLKF